ncbi:DUF1850 domain-containing protein [Oribacterium sp. NK2B42]|uniref:DUF1850 domain-containing protein n=1 Tax=Oribacterium sp. NK2B42 TaxID=689781 RepID=UPI0004104384|nr:DUF1850 domain-containing protein [Oribacterium sp. NK2B42]
MKNQFINHKKILVAVIALLAVTATVVIYIQLVGIGVLAVSDASDGKLYGMYPVRVGDTFSIGFIHSVNKSPLIDYYEIKADGIYVEKTVYYGFGAGVQTELSEGEKLEYGQDGSMIVSGFDKKMPDLTYFVGTVSDHTLRINEGKDISLRDLCGRNSRVRFSYMKWKFF